MPRTKSNRSLIRWKSPSTPPKTINGKWQALLRCSPELNSEKLAVSWGDEVQIELTRGTQLILAGLWQAGIRKQGTELFPCGAWEENCWHSDRDVDYLELELLLDEGYRLQRQLLLARKDRFLWLSDAILSPARPLGENPQHPKPRWDYASWLPLGGGVVFQPADESHEGHLLAKKKISASVIPAALPEWRADAHSGELAVVEGQLQHSLAANGDCLYAPLFLDLDPLRAKKPLTWRRLTIGENLHAVPKDVAAGFRVQAGNAQWVFYQALANRGNRTCLSHNTAYEFCCHRFLAKGKMEPILEIE